MSQKTNEQLLHALALLFNELDIESDEEVDRILREAGYDPEEVAKRGRTLVDNALARATKVAALIPSELAEMLPSHGWLGCSVKIK